MSGYRNYYDTGFTRNRSDVGKKDDDRSATSRIASKYSSYGANYQRDNTSSRDTASYSGVPRIKTTLEKKDTSHPPVSYRPIARTATSRSREPSPVSQSEKSSSSTSYSSSRLYPRPYTRSVSRERLDVTSPIPVLSKYTNSRSSVPKDELAPTKYPSRARDDTTTKYTPRTTKDEKIPRFTPSRATSREDLSTSSSSQKYINSRFLPKNSVEKSYTAYTRPSAARSKEAIRKNRELLNTLHVQHEQDKSRPVSRCSSVTPDTSSSRDKSRSDNTSANSKKGKDAVEMETVTVINRSTSPTPSRQNSFLRKRNEVAKIIEKQITRPKNRGDMVDKEIQSDRLDDSTKSSRFSGASRMSPAPWSSILDMKFSTPKSSPRKPSDSDQNSAKQSDSPKSISRASSTKSLNQSSSKSDKSKDHPTKSSSPSSSKSKLSPTKSGGQSSDKKHLPPTIPKSDSSGKTNSHSISAQNKDFRKSILNMNPDGTSKKVGRRSTSVSSADSDSGEAHTSEVTDVSENLATCKSFHKTSSSSKLPQKIRTDVAQASRRSPSSDASTASSSAASGNEEDAKTRHESNSKKTRSRCSSRTSACVSSADELSTDKSLKPPVSPRPGKDGVREADAKSFLMRALAPVTSLFKQKHSESGDRFSLIEGEGEHFENPEDSAQDHFDNNIDAKQYKAIRKVESGEKPWWLEESSQNSEDAKSSKSEPKKPFKIMSRVESGERAWWLEAAQEPAEMLRDGNRSPRGEKEENNNGKTKLKFRTVESGDAPWWLDENAEVPEGIETYPNYVRPDGTTEDGRVIYKMRKNDSGNTEWWLDSSEATSASKSKQESIMDAEYLERHRIRHIDSGERAWWISSSENIPDQCENEEEKVVEHKPVYSIRRQDSGEKAWWLQDENPTAQDEFDENRMPLGDRASPEGLEMPKDDEGRLSPYDNVPRSQHKQKRPTNLSLFISKHTNIDEILGTGCQIWSPLMDRVFCYAQQPRNEEIYTEIKPSQVKIHEGSQPGGVTSPMKQDNTGASPKAFATYGKLDDAALQLYKDGDYGSYLDLEASISEQQEEFEGFQSNKKNSIVLRTQLSVRVHTIIEKLLTSEGRELRRALFSLKQIFQEDKDLVHEFVQNDGLSCLIKVGSEADQNYQNYILRALGQVMLYVDGMNGVMEHNQTIQWLYSLISSKFRLVVKTALKLLLVFVEYTDSNCLLLIQAINTVDYSQGLLPWYNIMKLLRDFDSADTELLIYAMTLINKVLNGIPDQDTYYDQTDALEEQGIEPIIQRYMSKPGTDLDLLQQFQIYEAVLKYEDGEDMAGTPTIRHLDESIRKTLRSRKSVVGPSERRKSRRHSTGTTPLYSGLSRNNNSILQTNQEDEESSSSQSSGLNNSQLNGSYKDASKASDAGVTPALRRRRERAERQRSFMKEQQESAALLKNPPQNGVESHDITNGNYTNGIQQRISNTNNILNRSSSRKDMTPIMNAVNKLDSEDNHKQPWILSMMYNKSTDEKSQNIEESENTNDNERKVILQLKRENTVKDLTQKLASQNMLHSPSDETKVNRIGDMSGLISKAKEGLARSKSKADLLKSATSDNIPKLEAKKSENELRWEELAANLDRTLNLCDMDFTDLLSDDEVDVLAPAAVTNGIPPPPPPFMRENGGAPPPPPFTNKGPPPVPNPPVFGVNLQRSKPSETKIPIKKNKKTVKLFWKEVRDDPITAVKLKGGSIWDELCPVTVDTQKLEHLFESRAKDLITKKQQEMNKNKAIIVLDPKRSNAINIGMTKLPPPRSIKTAILKMDATIMNREGIEKLLTMLPTEEERSKIQEAQAASPDLPLGSAEQFLLTLASISELPARLKLWAFKLDFENTEREIAEPLMDLKHGFEVLKVNKTFRGILSTLLSIGNFLNGNEVKGFQIEYLAKVPEVKDTVHKHSLLHHLCHIVMEKFPDATDLYSEIGAITRASKIDFDELTLNIQRLEEDCKASWDHLKLIAKHDGSTMMKVKMSDFLSDCAERIILLGIIHRRIMNRFHKFLLWLGIPLHQISETKPNEFCRIVSEFALEYRTTRERVLQQLEKKANHRERNKTRGKMITDIGKFRSKEDRADAELRQLLGSDMSDVESLQGTLPWRRTRRDNNRSFLSQANGNLTDGDDEILETLVKTATKGSSRTAPRERKRTRHADRKSLRRTLKNGLSEEEKIHLSAYIKGY